VEHTRRGLRVADILFRNHSDEFVAFLNATDAQTANVVASRVRARISENPLRLQSGLTIAISATVTVVCTPIDGTSIGDLLASARARSGSQNPGLTEPSVH
jgi:diguanylate cyclase (GGDEF)-like protein